LCALNQDCEPLWENWPNCRVFETEIKSGKVYDVITEVGGKNFFYFIIK